MRTLLLANARVITCDARDTIADTIAVLDGKVLAVGSEEAVRARAGADAIVADLGGHAVIPGLIDTHPHLMHFGTIAEPLVDLTDAPANPVFIQAWAPVVPNVCALNSLALRQLGISGATPDQVDDVRIEKDAAGEPTGLLRGSVTNYYCDIPFMNRLLGQIPVWQRDAIAPGAMRAMRTANAMGVTTVYEAHLMTFSLIEIYRLLRRQDRLTIRVLCCPEAEPAGVPWSDPFQPPTLSERLDRARNITDRSDDMFQVDGVTVSPYGPCWPGFTLMREPYQDPYGKPTTGKTMVSEEKVGQAIRFCRDHGVRLNIVTSGLAEADSHLAQLEALGPVPAGWLLQHLYFAEPELVRRFAALGFDLTTTMSFSWGKGELVRERFGDRFLPDFIPLARLLDSGMRVAAGTDWGPKNVFEHIALAVEPRYGASGRPAATPGISRSQALAMWTREAARVLRWDGIGSIEPGKHADLVITDRDPLSCSLQDLAGTRVVTTMLGGRTVHGIDPTESSLAP